MTVSYLDTSAAMKLVALEQHSDEMTAFVRAASDRALISSWLLHTELHCAAGRRPGDIDPAQLTAVLSRVLLVDITRGDLLAAGTHVPLRSQDAIHLATALRVGVDELVTYDRELAAAAQQAGIRVVTPDA